MMIIGSILGLILKGMEICDGYISGITKINDPSKVHASSTYQSLHDDYWLHTGLDIEGHGDM